MKEINDDIYRYLTPQEIFQALLDIAKHRLDNFEIDYNLNDNKETTPPGIYRTLFNQVGEFCHVVNLPDYLDLDKDIDNFLEKMQKVIQAKKGNPVIGIGIFRKQTHKKTRPFFALSIVFIPKGYRPPYLKPSEVEFTKEDKIYAFIEAKDRFKLNDLEERLKNSFGKILEILHKPERGIRKFDYGALAVFSALILLLTVKSKYIYLKSSEQEAAIEPQKVAAHIHHLLPKLDLIAYHRESFKKIKRALNVQGIALDNVPNLIEFKNEFWDGCSPAYISLKTSTGEPIEIRILSLEDDNRARELDYLKRARSLTKTAEYILDKQNLPNNKKEKIANEIVQLYKKFRVNLISHTVTPGVFKNPLWQNLFNHKEIFKNNNNFIENKQNEAKYKDIFEKKNEWLKNELVTLVDKLINLVGSELREGEIQYVSKKPVPILVHQYEVYCENYIVQLIEIQRSGCMLQPKQVGYKALTDYQFKPRDSDKPRKNYIKQKLSQQGIIFDVIINLLPSNWKEPRQYKKLNRRLRNFIEQESGFLENLEENFKIKKQRYQNLMELVPIPNNDYWIDNNDTVQDEDILITWQALTLYSEIIDHVNEIYSNPVAGIAIKKALFPLDIKMDSQRYWQDLENRLTCLLNDAIRLIMHKIDEPEPDLLSRKGCPINPKRPISSNSSAIRDTEGLSNTRTLNCLGLTLFRSSSKPPIKFEWRDSISINRLLIAMRNVEQGVAAIAQRELIRNPILEGKETTPQHPLKIKIFSHSLLTPPRAPGLFLKMYNKEGDETQMLWNDFTAKCLCHNRVFPVTLEDGRHIWVKPFFITINEPVNAVSRAMLDEVQGYTSAEGYVMLCIKAIQHWRDFFETDAYRTRPTFLENNELWARITTLFDIVDESIKINSDDIDLQQKKLAIEHNELYKILIEYQAVQLGFYFPRKLVRSLDEIKTSCIEKLTLIEEHYSELKETCKTFLRNWESCLTACIKTMNIRLNLNLFAFYSTLKEDFSKTNYEKLIEKPYFLINLFFSYLYDMWKKQAKSNNLKENPAFRQWDAMMDNIFLFHCTISTYLQEMAWSNIGIEKALRKAQKNNLPLIHNRRAAFSLIFSTQLGFYAEFYCKSGEDRTGYLNVLILAYQLFFKLNKRFPNFLSTQDNKNINTMLDSFLEYGASCAITAQNAPGARGFQSPFVKPYNNLMGKLAKGIYPKIPKNMRLSKSYISNKAPENLQFGESENNIKIHINISPFLIYFDKKVENPSSSTREKFIFFYNKVAPPEQKIDSPKIKNKKSPFIGKDFNNLISQYENFFSDNSENFIFTYMEHKEKIESLKYKILDIKISEKIMLHKFKVSFSDYSNIYSKNINIRLNKKNLDKNLKLNKLKRKPSTMEGNNCLLDSYFQLIRYDLRKNRNLNFEVTSYDFSTAIRNAIKKSLEIQDGDMLGANDEKQGVKILKAIKAYLEDRFPGMTFSFNLSILVTDNDGDLGIVDNLNEIQNQIEVGQIIIPLKIIHINQNHYEPLFNLDIPDSEINPIVSEEQVNNDFKSEIAKLIKEENFTFRLIRQQPNEIIIRFTAADQVSVSPENSEKWLNLITVLKNEFTQLNLNEKLTITPNWLTMELKITSQTVNSMNSVGALLKDAGMAYWNWSQLHFSSQVFHKPENTVGMKQSPQEHISDNKENFIDCHIQ